MKKITVMCTFNGAKSPFAIYISDDCSDELGPIHFQEMWLQKDRGGSIPADFKESISKLHQEAKRFNASLENLVMFAFQAAQEQAKAEGEATSAASSTQQPSS